MTDESAGIGPCLRVGYVPGVQPDKWLARWRQRHPDVPVSARRVGDPRAGLVDSADDDGFDVVFFREPDDAPRSAPEGLLRVPLYTETMAVVAHKDHEIAVFDALVVTDLVDETWLDPVDPIAAHVDEVSAAVDLAAAGVGLLVLPLPYIRSFSRRDVVERPLEGVPATRMGMAWSPAREGEALIDEFVGIVRGRRVGSARGVVEQPTKRNAREKAEARARTRGGQRSRTPTRGRRRR